MIVLPESNMSYFETLALKKGIPKPFIVLSATDYALSIGHESVIFPEKEGLQMWEEYKNEGLDELFFFHHILEDVSLD